MLKANRWHSRRLMMCRAKIIRGSTIYIDEESILRVSGLYDEWEGAEVRFNIETTSILKNTFEIYWEATTFSKSVTRMPGGFLQYLGAEFATSSILSFQIYIKTCFLWHLNISYYDWSVSIHIFTLRLSSLKISRNEIWQCSVLRNIIIGTSSSVYLKSSSIVIDFTSISEYSSSVRP